MEFLVQRCLLLCLYTTSALGVATIQLTSSTGDGAACPNDPVVFTCSVSGTVLRWIADPPPGYVISGQVTQLLFSTITVNLLPAGVEGFMFQAAVTNTSNGTLTSTLTTITEVSLLNGSVVTCSSGGTMESRSITVANSPSSPSTPILASQHNVVSSTIITLDWESPSSTGGVSLSYVLIISPTPLSGSTVTVETTSAQIITSYNILYTVAIRAVNCAGFSSDIMMTMIPSIVTCPSNPTPANRVTINGAPPLPALVGSTLSFTCNGQMVLATCESDGRWSPDSTTYNCPSEVTCGPPVTPSRGSVDVQGQTSPFLMDSVINFRCDKGLFPAGDMSSTCDSVGGVGIWRPDTNIICRDIPVNCSLPKEPSKGIIIVDYELLNETVFAGTMLTYQCDNGLSLAGPNTITCTNAGVWSTEPEAIMCVSPTEGPTATSLSIGAVAAISVIITFFVAAILGFLTGLIVMHLCSRKKAVYSLAAKGQANVGPTAQPAGPVYEEVSPKEEMELNTNQAYGPVGL
ncbi:CUB and sushi domain-containing protein 3-like [Halichondria panicea]|uniref:CUB and sushi domain-containing protein 3-like n=1 Tax=Halichondria panicea TaxID=6063 RepID=UPI00312B5D95